MVEKLLLNLTRAMKAGTPSERKIAKYLIEHLDELPFETAQTLAAKLSLSPMTVGRFLRSLGYRQFSDIRADLRHAEETAGADQPAMIDGDERQPNPFSQLLSQQIQAIQAAFDMTAQPIWRLAMSEIAAAADVFLATSPEGRGATRHFHGRLLECRGHVQYLGSDSAAYVALWDFDPGQTLLVIMDCGGSLAPLQHLAATARRSGYRTLLITTRFYEWGPESADLCLAMPQAQNGGQGLLQLVSLLEFTLCALSAGADDSGRARAKNLTTLKRSLRS
ncbi:MurR/RpiR family transcriptional regulator [Agrobacterium tumefaciens]|uniref:MurR/RpiR family transcriptional regulator n=1 Tax=Rhizobium/Agrobacterium group TaxID=227290 RepID=UPI0007E0EAA9|nr:MULTISPECIES: MurR/RpiR family transcriptional regulator [Rhizobium/Agrobacterium group]AQS65213.1 MurR/RpiR family transcriptional regulator [Rhizobium rhizogenes]MCZ7440925.1 MurR/RpiR family transcriptional regulator [Rhizobium rhizogenes]NSZ81976.1 MurR/RpiR family transcriptional regulator [Agrobacterium tumefaciens]OAM63037.1 RpiR family transcriptional regulator [Rhizobium rhizogenes]